jgi:hypothetical protein
MLHAISRCSFLRSQLKRSSRTLLPQLIRPFASHPFTPVLSPRYFLRKIPQWSRNNQLIASIGQLLKLEKHEEALQFFKSRISSIPSWDRISRFSIYERAITVFVNYKFFNDALELHQQMFDEGMYSSSCLRAKMLVCSDIIKARHGQGELDPLFSKLSQVLSRPSYSERNLCELFDVVRSHPFVDSQFVRKLVDAYIDSRLSGYQLRLTTVDKLFWLYAHVGGIDAAEGLDDYRRHASTASYTTLLSELTNKGSLSSKHINSILDQMKESKIPVDLPLFNVLIRSAVRQGNLHQAFALYDTILMESTPHMIPDSYAFGSLFNALLRLATLRSSTDRPPRQPSNAPSPRQLFREMLECHVLTAQAAIPRRHPVVAVSTLNVALRLFMRTMDYPGAFVTLQTFRTLDLKPDTRSYRVVLDNLLERFRRALLAERSWRHHTSWAVNFLGGDQVRGLQLEDVWSEVVDALLEFSVGGTKYRAPGFAVLLGEEEPPMDTEWDVEPLERLVAKAILSADSPKVVSEQQSQRTLREKLAPYFYEMVPDRLWRGRRLRRATG